MTLLKRPVVEVGETDPPVCSPFGYAPLSDSDTKWRCRGIQARTADRSTGGYALEPGSPGPPTRVLSHTLQSTVTPLAENRVISGRVQFAAIVHAVPSETRGTPGNTLALEPGLFTALIG